MTSKEALERLKFIADKELNTGSKSYKDLQDFWNYKEPLNCIEKLVDKDIPKKVITGLLGIDRCSKCKTQLSKNKERFCKHCGQRLDWSD